MKLTLSMFSIPRVDNCCFCINLRTGSIVIAWFGIFINILILIGLTLHLIVNEDDLENSYYDKERREKQKGYLLLSYAVFAVMALMDVLANVILLIGILKKRYSFIGQWLFSSIIWFLLAVVGQLFRILALAGEGSYYLLVHAFVISFFCFGLRFYWWLSVYTVYDLVKSGKPLEQPWEEINDHDDDEERAINKE